MLKRESWEEEWITEKNLTEKNLTGKNLTNETKSTNETGNCMKTLNVSVYQLLTM